MGLYTVWYLSHCSDVCILLGMLEVFGSWNKVVPQYEGAPFDNEVERQLQDAMGEQEAITIVTRDTSVKTGFSPPGP